jgi:hypothetical protein
MMKKWAIALVLIPAICFSISCRKKAEVKGVELSVDFSAKQLSDNLITDITYTWKTTPEFQKISQDLCASVHFWHNNNMLFQDDYFPDIPTSQWEPGKEYKFVHRIFIPPFIDEFDPQFSGEEKLMLSIGLYSPFDRTGKVKFQVLEKKLTVIPPPPDTPEIIYEDGWNEQETNLDANLKKWRWTAKEARCLIDNPKRDALLVIKGGVNLDVLKDQKVIFKINDTVIDEFIPVVSDFDKTYEIKKEILGDKGEFYLTIATDQTFIPALLDPNSKDKRELGLKISFIYFR